MGAATDYAKSYSSFSGADIVASFNNKVFAELQGLTYSVSREKVPIYTMGSAEPRSFSRGKRGIAGTIVFSVFDRDAMVDAFAKDLQEKEIGIQKFIMNDPKTVDALTGSTVGFTSIDEWDAQMSNLAGTGSGEMNSIDVFTKDNFVPHYADEILPIDITLTFANEYGNRAVMMIYGVEFLNEGSGFSSDTIVTEKAYTYVARRIEPMRSLGEEEGPIIASSW